MKLSNKGFGLRDMIIYTSVLLLFLLFAVYSIDSLHKTLEEDNKEAAQEYQESIKNNSDEIEEENSTKDEPVNYSYYNTLEELLERSTLNYMNDYPFDLSMSIEKVTSDTLINLGYMSVMKDQFGNSTCQGYSNVFQDENMEYVIHSFISCDNYVTEGY